MSGPIYVYRQLGPINTRHGNAIHSILDLRTRIGLLTSVGIPATGSARDSASDNDRLINDRRAHPGEARVSDSLGRDWTLTHVRRRRWRRRWIHETRSGVRFSMSQLIDSVISLESLRPRRTSISLIACSYVRTSCTLRRIFRIFATIACFSTGI